MDIEVNTLAQIKAETGRDLDNQIDENTLVSGEKSNGTFGVFKLFAAIKNCIDNWITTIAGNKNFTGAVTINSKAVATTEAVNNALADYVKVKRIKCGEYLKITINQYLPSGLKGVNFEISSRLGDKTLLNVSSDSYGTYSCKCFYSGREDAKDFTKYYYNGTTNPIVIYLLAYYANGADVSVNCSDPNVNYTIESADSYISGLYELDIERLVTKSDLANYITQDDLHLLESGVITPEQIEENYHIVKVIHLQHTYKLIDDSKISFVLTPVSYRDTAYITATGHWGDLGEDAEGMVQSNKLTVYITNLYQNPQTSGCYYQIFGNRNSIAN